MNRRKLKCLASVHMYRLYNFQKFMKLTQSNFYKTSHTMTSLDDLINDGKHIYQYSVRSVQPEELIHRSIQKESNIIRIQGKEFAVDKNAYIVGFGKAVLGMAIALVNILQDHIVSGILSIPKGMSNKNARQKLKSSRIEVFEGAQNNIPDKDSLLAADKVSELVSSLEKSSLLIVLISGGGSALLPSPRFPLTLEEKQKVIKILVSRGATIEEINAIRKKLSFLKGGGLAQLAKPAQVISLILSDIIGDPIGLIASGPTVENSDDHKLITSIVKKYRIKDILPVSAMYLLQDIPTESVLKHQSFEFVTNFIIGNNTVALNAAAGKATELQYKSVIMTNKLCGLATDVGKKIIQLTDAALTDNCSKFFHICEELNIEKKKGIILLDKIKELEASMGLCILFGGETTVEVKGNGIGGRNQELALSGSLELSRKKSNSAIVMLSAGTDGIDGPTDAAGAIATPFVIDTARKEGIDAQSFLNDNNSYNFYNLLQNEMWHVKTGHTGTNVMDIIIVLIKKL